MTASVPQGALRLARLVVNLTSTVFSLPSVLGGAVTHRSACRPCGSKTIMTRKITVIAPQFQLEQGNFNICGAKSKSKSDESHSIFGIKSAAQRQSGPSPLLGSCRGSFAASMTRSASGEANFNDRTTQTARGDLRVPLRAAGPGSHSQRTEVPTAERAAGPGPAQRPGGPGVHTGGPGHIMTVLTFA